MAGILALSGFMGCGKSTVAAILADRTGCFWFDLDDTIETGEGRSISEIFATDGQGAFRKLEYKYLERIISDYEDFDLNIIVALGGGTVTDSRCASLIRKKCKCVYLRASDAQIFYNIKLTGVARRPLLGDVADNDVLLSEKISSLLEKRRPLYEKTADIIIDTDGLSFEEMADAVAEAVGRSFA